MRLSMINRLKNRKDINELEARVNTRFLRGRLTFGNKIQLAEVNVLGTINYLRVNKSIRQKGVNHG